jgi:hypothetical protein
VIFHRKLLVYLSFFSHCLQLDREILLYSLILGDFPVYSYVLPMKIRHVLIVFLCFPTFFPGFSRLSRRKRSPFLARLSPPGFGLAGAPPQEALRATKAREINPVVNPHVFLHEMAIYIYNWGNTTSNINDYIYILYHKLLYLHIYNCIYKYNSFPDNSYYSIGIFGIREISYTRRRSEMAIIKGE